MGFEDSKGSKGPVPASERPTIPGYVGHFMVRQISLARPRSDWMFTEITNALGSYMTQQQPNDPSTQDFCAIPLLLVETYISTVKKYRCQRMPGDVRVSTTGIWYWTRVC